jgi:POT family proton-dependent oligopeptide transporter
VNSRTTTAGSASLEPAADADGSRGQPEGFSALCFTELWERFSFHGMRALLTLFMVAPALSGGLGYSSRKATVIYGNTLLGVYLLPILGGFIADNFIGSRLAVLGGAAAIACGDFALTVRSETAFFSGLVLIAIGTGLLKPNLTTMVGRLYAPGDARRDAGFSLFYMGITFGALTAPFATGFLAQSHEVKDWLSAMGYDPICSWHWGFGAAGAGMTLGLITYGCQNRSLAAVDNPPPPGAPRPWGKLGLVALGTAVLFAAMLASDWLVYPILGAQIAAILYFAARPDLSARRFAVLLVLFTAAEFFWAALGLAGSTVSSFGERLTRLETPVLNLHLPLVHLTLGGVFPPSCFQSANSIFVILLAPGFAWLWIRLGPRQPSGPGKFVIGLLLLGLSFLLMVPAARLTVAGRVSPLWLTGLFFLQTLGELCLMPAGLSAMTRLAPPRLAGLIMGVWFLAATLGTKLAGALSDNSTTTDAGALAELFWRQALALGAGALVLLALARWLRRLMAGVS